VGPAAAGLARGGPEGVASKPCASLRAWGLATRRCACDHDGQKGPSPGPSPALGKGGGEGLLSEVETWRRKKAGSGGSSAILRSATCSAAIAAGRSPRRTTSA